MSNLSLLLEGGTVSLPHSYDHEFGAGMIAMESAEALKDIFETTFYDQNTYVINSHMGGYENVWESFYAPMMEMSVKDAFTKIKEFFKMLKNKVVDFLHNIKRYLSGIFGNDKKWVENYEKELRAIKGQLGDYEIKMFNYSIQEFSSDTIDKDTEALMDGIKSNIRDVVRKIDQGKETDDSVSEICDKYFEAYAKDICGKAYDGDNAQEALWSKMRNGAKSKDDTEDTKVQPLLDNMIDTLKNADKVLSKLDAYASKNKSMYDKAIKFVDSTKNEAEKLDSVSFEAYAELFEDVDALLEEMHQKRIAPNREAARKMNRDFKKYMDEDKKRKEEAAKQSRSTTGTTNNTSSSSHPNPPSSTSGNGDSKSNPIVLSGNKKTIYTSYLSKYSQTVSKMQTLSNQNITAAKTAMLERNAIYKKALTGAFAYAKKNKKK